MPELPEVHALAADLDARLSGRMIERFDAVSFAALKTFDPPVSALAGRTIRSVTRHGKFLDITVDAVGSTPTDDDGAAVAGAEATVDAAGSTPSAGTGAEAAAGSTPSDGDGAAGAGTEANADTGADTDTGAGAARTAEPTGPAVHIVLHLARAGWIRWRESAPVTPAKPTRPGNGPLAARLVLDDGSGLDITEAGSKKSLAIYLVTDPSEVPGVARLGPDPLDPAFGEDVFRGILASSGRSQIKGVLRNQSTIAGIGNAYSDEILHTARMSPFKPAAMTEDEAHQLFEAMQFTLRAALMRADGLHASELKKEKKSGLQVHGRTGEPCPVCGDTVRQVIYADSTFQYCPTCQTGGKPLADRVLSRLLK